MRRRVLEPWARLSCRAQVPLRGSAAWNQASGQGLARASGGRCASTSRSGDSASSPGGGASPGIGVAPQAGPSRASAILTMTGASVLPEGLEEASASTKLSAIEPEEDGEEHVEPEWARRP